MVSAHRPAWTRDCQPPAASVRRGAVSARPAGGPVGAAGRRVLPGQVLVRHPPGFPRPTPGSDIAEAASPDPRTTRRNRAGQLRPQDRASGGNFSRSRNGPTSTRSSRPLTTAERSMPMTSRRRTVAPVACSRRAAKTRSTARRPVRRMGAFAAQAGPPAEGRPDWHKDQRQIEGRAPPESSCGRQTGQPRQAPPITAGQMSGLGAQRRTTAQTAAIHGSAAISRAATACRLAVVVAVRPSDDGDGSEALPFSLGLDGEPSPAPAPGAPRTG